MQTHQYLTIFIFFISFASSFPQGSSPSRRSNAALALTPEDPKDSEFVEVRRTVTVGDTTINIGAYTVGSPGGATPLPATTTSSHASSVTSSTKSTRTRISLPCPLYRKSLTNSCKLRAQSSQQILGTLPVPSPHLSQSIISSLWAEREEMFRSPFRMGMGLSFLARTKDKSILLLGFMIWLVGIILRCMLRQTALLGCLLMRSIHGKWFVLYTEKRLTVSVPRLDQLQWRHRRTILVSETICSVILTMRKLSFLRLMVLQLIV